MNSPINQNYNNINDLYRSCPKPKKENKKINFKTLKHNTICSLNDVECFLNTVQHTIKYIKLYKLLK